MATATRALRLKTRHIVAFVDNQYVDAFMIVEFNLNEWTIAMRRTLSIALLTLGVSLASAASASAQTATEAQKEALRSDCVSDFLSMCKGVPRGGAPAFECLAKNYDKLSSSCQAAVKAVDPKVE